MVKPSRSRGHGILVFIFRLLLLGVGSSIAWLLGVAIAQFFPAPNPETPLFEDFLRRSGALVNSTRRLPQTLQGERILQPVFSPTTVPARPNTTVQLTVEQQQQLQAELVQLQAQVSTLRDRTTALETQLGTSSTAEPLETRLQTLSQQLNPAPSGTTPTGQITPIAGTPGNSVPQARSLAVTLPSDVLFGQSQSQLLPQNQAILDSVITELRSYQRAVIQVAGHTDNSGNAEANRELSFQRAEAVQRYLEGALGGNYHWVAVGYGGNRPLVENDTDINRQRNRRIEISIDPQ